MYIMTNKEIYFENMFMKLTAVLIVLVMSIQFFLHIQEADFSFFQMHAIPASAVEYWTQASTTSSFEEAKQAPDEGYSTSKHLVDGNEESVWVRFRLEENDKVDAERLYVAHEYWHIETAYANIKGRWQALRPNDEHIYSSITLPKDIDDDQYIYVHLSGTNIQNGLIFYTDSTINFIRFQIWLFAFRTATISILAILLILNIVLAFYSRRMEYSVHAMQLMASVNTLMQISGIQKLIWGQLNSYSGYFWGFMVCLMVMFFQYNYFGVKYLHPWVVKLYQILMASMIAIMVTVSFVQIPEIMLGLHWGVMTICMIGAAIAIYSCRYVETVSSMFIVGTILMFFSMCLYVLGSFDILPWNDFTANLIYLALSVEAVLFTSGIIQQLRFKEEQIHKLEREVDTDQLTKLHNRNYFENITIPKIQQHEKLHHQISLLMMDIDYFKNVNDTYGHNEGDQLLKELSLLSKNCVRKNDDVIRWGGEEFLLVLYEINSDRAMITAEKIRTVVEDHSFTCGNITVSIGVAEKDGDEIKDWINRADQALYQAKRDGRNQIAVRYRQDVLLQIGWNPDYQCADAAINKKHQELITKMNKLIRHYFSHYEENVFLEMYDDLIHFTVQHFQEEEHILLRVSYPEAEKHQNLHQDIVRQTYLIREAFLSHKKTPFEVINFLISKVVMGHMITEDVKFFKYLGPK